MSRREPSTRWWSTTLAAGALVVVAVWALLEALRRAVLDVEVGVDRVWTAGKQLAQQTQAAHLLSGTKAGTAALREALEGSRTEGGAG